MKNILTLLSDAEAERATFLQVDLRAQLDSSEIQSILDMGAGSGTMTAAALEVFPHAHATLVDVVSRLRLEEFTPPERITQCTALDWPAEKELANKTFDLVLSMDVLEHVPQWKVALSSLFKYVRPEGYLYVQTPSNYPSPNWPQYDILKNWARGIAGKNNPATHVRNGLSCKSILDVCRAEFTPLVAAEDYVVDGRFFCEFKPRTHLLLKKIT